MPPSRAGASALESRLRKVVGQLALEFGKITGDHCNVEAPQDRLLGLAIKQESERRLDATLRRVPVSRQSFASVSCHGHMMTSLAVSHADDDLELEWIAFAGSRDRDHSLPLIVIAASGRIDVYGIFAPLHRQPLEIRGERVQPPRAVIGDDDGLGEHAAGFAIAPFRIK